MHILSAENVYEPDHIPVWAPLVVDPSMAPSPMFPPHPPSEPASPTSSVSYDSLDEELGFPDSRAPDHHEHDQVQSIGVDSSTQALDKASTSPPPSFLTESPQLPVSLPLNSPQWAQILASQTPYEVSSTNDLIQVVEGDVSRLHHSDNIERLREHNRQAIAAGWPLVSIPNTHGLKAPPGYNYPITSVSQISALSTAELGAWLKHYDLSYPKDDASQRNKRHRLAAHLGLDRDPLLDGLKHPQQRL
ncbi:hypothetical protein FS837_010327 [Tulasnella sp. UAMH 9824]|nr:hypothetical protein FS837_010327 [Tulasnella sp. UAMH 9824]